MLPDFRDPNLQWVLLGSTLLGIAAAVLGCFALLRGRSLMGDALAHAALPGVCCAFLFAEAMRSRGWLNLESKNLAVLLVGASLSGLLGAWCIAAITRHSRIKEDAAQAIVLSVFFGAGVVLLSFIQQGESGQQSGLDKFLWGSAASLVLSDVRAMTFVAAVLCLMSWALYKEFKLLCFDPDFGNGLGLPMNRLDGLLLLMIVGAVVIGLQAVGVVLISALLIMPPAAARFWTEKLHVMTPLAALLGGLSGALGAIFSALAPRMPTGPLIVLAATAMFLFSLLFAPGRGALARLLRHLSTRRLVRRENLLRDLYEIAEERGDDEATVSEDRLLEKRRVSQGTLNAALRELQNAKLITPARSATSGWQFTGQGLEEGYRVVRRHRLWETFLMYETSLGAQSVDRDADAVEHFLPPEAIAQLEELMRRQGREPKLSAEFGMRSAK
jgi:manganese/zinc/iron transport system permease protein